MKILSLLLLFCSLSSHAEERSECKIAIVEASEGNIVVIASDGAARTVEDGLLLQPSDLLKTGRNAWVDLRLCDGSGLRVGENAKFYYESVNIEQFSFVEWAFELARGTILAIVANEGKGDRVKLRMKTPTAALGVRGTEFVVDAEEEGAMETNLHTIEGEVLMGHVNDFDKLRDLRGQELDHQFEIVGRERMSLIRKGDSRPLRAAVFKVWEFRATRKAFFKDWEYSAERKVFFGHPLTKRGWTEIRQRFKDAERLLKKRRSEKSLFERPREKIEKHLEQPHGNFPKMIEEKPALPNEVERERSVQGPNQAVVEIKEKKEKKLERSGAKLEALKKKMEQHRLDRQHEKSPEAWKKNIYRGPVSPRFPDLRNEHR